MFEGLFPVPTAAFVTARASVFRRGFRGGFAREIKIDYLLNNRFRKIPPWPVCRNKTRAVHDAYRSTTRIVLEKRAKFESVRKTFFFFFYTCDVRCLCSHELVRPESLVFNNDAFTILFVFRWPTIFFAINSILSFVYAPLLTPHRHLVASEKPDRNLFCQWFTDAVHAS